MPIALGEWRVRIGRFVRWAPVEIDFEKFIEIALERRRQILQKVDDLLENTRKNVAKQEPGGESAETSSGPASTLANQSDSGVSVSNAVLRNTSQAKLEPHQGPIPNQSSTLSSHDVDQPMSSSKENLEDDDTPTAIASSSSPSSGPPRQGRQCISDSTFTPAPGPQHCAHQSMPAAAPSPSVIVRTLNLFQ